MIYLIHLFTLFILFTLFVTSRRLDLLASQECKELATHISRVQRVGEVDATLMLRKDEAKCTKKMQSGKG